jgi:hypothetical protein
MILHKSNQQLNSCTTDPKISYALSDASLLDATQWQDVDRRLNRLRAALAGSHCLHRPHNDDQPLQVSTPTDCLF